MEANGKKRSKKEYVKRYGLFSVGLIFTSFGIAFVTKMQLGTSPISAIPYSLSLIVPSVTMGNWTIVFSALLILLQLFILKKKANIPELVLQLVISFPFGYLIDGSAWLLKNLNPQIYAVRIVCLLLGCAIVAFGVYIQVLADVVMLPGDAFVRTIAKVTDKEFGSVRVWSDVIMVSVAALLCVIFLHNLSGAREGTIIAALITGNIVKLYRRLFEKRFSKIFQ
ncbi:MAG: YitT family protein [Ruminococcus sp.]